MELQPDDPIHDDEELRAHAGAAVRHLGHALVGHHAAPELLSRVAARVEELAASLDEGLPRSRPGGDMQNSNFLEIPADGEVMTSFPDRPISGAASPWGVDLVVTRRGEEVEGRCTLHAAHEGAPGRSHGGVLAATFDDLFGFVLTLQQTIAFTGDLYVRYEAPTPLHRELVFKARAVGKEGRKLFLTADAWDGDKRFASAKATFIQVDSNLWPAGA